MTPEIKVLSRSQITLSRLEMGVLVTGLQGQLPREPGDHRTG